jgi:hypothetical protein
LPSAQSFSNSCLSRSISSRTLVLFNVAMAILYHGIFPPPVALTTQRIRLSAPKKLTCYEIAS